MATQSKTQYLADLQAYLKRRYKPKTAPAPARLPVIDAVVYAICHEGATREQANQALSRFKDQFSDWNEVRVSHLGEIEEALADVPAGTARARGIRKFLRQLFEKTYSFTALDALAKKPLKEALKALQAYDAFASDYVTATVVQQALGGHAIPVDEAARAALGKLGIREDDVATLRGLIERAIPKNRGFEFLELLEEMAQDEAIERDPKAPRWNHVPAKDKEAKPQPKDAKPAKDKEAAKPQPKKTAPAAESEPVKPSKEPKPAPPKKGKGKPDSK